MFTNQQIEIMVDALEYQIEVEHTVLLDAAKSQDWEMIKNQEHRIQNINTSMVILKKMMKVPTKENIPSKTELVIQYVTELIEQNKDYTVRAVAEKIGCAPSTAQTAIHRAKQNTRFKKGS